MKRRLIHPETYYEYRESIWAGKSVPSVYNSLVEVAIKDGYAPERIATAWTLRVSLVSAVGVAGAVCFLFNLWLLGLSLIGLHFWIGTKATISLNVRLAYCAAIDSSIGVWATRKGYLSLVPMPDDLVDQCRELNKQYSEIARTDLEVRASKLVTCINLTLGFLILLAKTIIGVMLIVAAVRSPDGLTIGVGGIVGAFYLIQSVVRIPILFRKPVRLKSSVHADQGVPPGS
jgi:hypothetical protein